MAFIKTHKGIIIIGGVIIVLAVLAWPIYKYVRYKLERRPFVSFVFPADVTSDGAPDLVAIYPGENSPDSVIEAMDYRTKEVFWRSNIGGRYHVYLGDGPPVLVFSDRFVLTNELANVETRGRIPQVAAHLLKSGEKIWSFRLPETREWEFTVRIAAYKGILLLFSRDYGSRASFLTALKMENGEKMWEVSVNVLMKAPQFIDDYVIIDGGEGSTWERIHILTGKMEKFPCRGHGYLYHDRFLFFTFNDKGELQLMELDVKTGATKPVLQNNDPVVLNDVSFMYHPIGMYKGRLVYGMLSSEDVSTLGKVFPTRLKIRTFEGDLSEKVIDFPDQFGIYNYSERWQIGDPAHSTLHVIESRYVPIVLSKVLYLNVEPVQKMLIILDLDEGKIIWKSAIAYIGQRVLFPWDIFYKDGYYFMGFPLLSSVPSEPTGLLIVDGRTGKFKEPVKLSINRKDIGPQAMNLQLAPWLISKGVIYGWEQGWWVMEMESMTLGGKQNEDLSLESARKEAEQLFGPLPK